MKQKNWLPSLFILLLSLFNVLIFLYCKSQPIVKPLNEKLFVQVYCDVVVYADVVEPTHRDAFVDSVLNHYGVSREQFLTTVTFYSKDEKRWERVFTKIIAELELREKKFKAIIDSSRAKKLKDEKRLGIQ